MTATNPITGDAIKSKANSKEYQDNYDSVFRKVKEQTEVALNKSELLRLKEIEKCLIEMGGFYNSYGCGYYGHKEFTEPFKRARFLVGIVDVE